MRIFVYEFLTAGGCWAHGNQPPTGSLLGEGRAMRDALASDLARLDGVDEVLLLHDARLTLPSLAKQRIQLVRSAGEERHSFQKVAASADAALVIAPEFGLSLLDRVLWAEEAGARLLSPASAIVELCGNKQRTCEHLQEHGIAVPPGVSFSDELPELDDDFFPAVLKPIDGAGSQHVQLIHSAAELRSADLRRAPAWRLERFHAGLTVSVSILTGPGGYMVLPPCSQRLSRDGRFTYLGGATPLPNHLAVRAKRQAEAVARSLVGARGYLGIDMVLGEAENETTDTVIEINPRLTTSYLGLRQACKLNLAEAMLGFAQGKPVSITFHDRPIEFAPPAE